MNGGTFTTGKEKERAGIYFNFKTTALILTCRNGLHHGKKLQQVFTV